MSSTHGVSEKCPNCGETGPFSSPTHGQRRCTGCMHRGDAETFKNPVNRGRGIETDGGRVIEPSVDSEPKHGISHVRASLEHLIGGIKHDDLERSADTFDKLAAEYEESAEKAAENPPACQISEWVARLWEYVDVSEPNFAGVLEDAAADCRSAAQEAGR